MNSLSQGLTDLEKRECSKNTYEEHISFGQDGYCEVGGLGSNEGENG